MTVQPATLAPANPATTASVLSPFERDRFLLKQKHLALTEKYAIFDEQDRQVFFVRRQAHHLRQLLAAAVAIVIALAFVVGSMALAFEVVKNDAAQMAIAITGSLIGIFGAIAAGIWLAPKRHIGFFTDQAMSKEALTVLQDQKVAFINATFTAADGELNLIGWYRKNYLYNIFRKRWYIYDAQGAIVCVCLEDSILRSIVRRLLKDFVPFMRTNFIILAPDFQTKLGEFNRQFTLFDKYVLDLTPDAQRRFDRRLAVGLAVLLDTAEKR